jgi:hypothetical protein
MMHHFQYDVKYAITHHRENVMHVRWNCRREKLGDPNSVSRQAGDRTAESGCAGSGTPAAWVGGAETVAGDGVDGDGVHLADPGAALNRVAAGFERADDFLRNSFFDIKGIR